VNSGPRAGWSPGLPYVDILRSSCSMLVASQQSLPAAMRTCASSWGRLSIIRSAVSSDHAHSWVLV